LDLLKKIVLILCSIAILILVLIYLSGGFHERIEPDKVEAGKRLYTDEATDTVYQIVETEKAEIVGTLRAETRTEISPRILATIEAMNVRAGDTVHKGDVLVTLDDRELKANLERAKQAVAAAEADLKNAQADYERYKKLLEEKVISTREADQVEARYTIAQAHLQQTHEAKTAAETMLSYSVIKAPVSGIVIDKKADVGDTATPGQPLLVLYDPSRLRIEAPVPEGLASKLNLGKVLQVKLDTINKTLEGPIVEIVPQAEAATRTVLVKVRLPKEEGMVEGMFGRLLIPSRERIRLCLAESAVRKVGQLHFVDVVQDDRILERRQVKLGEHSEYGRVEVLSGLNADERVVLYGPPAPSLSPDTKIFTREKAR